MLIKITLKYYFSPMRLAKIKDLTLLFWGGKAVGTKAPSCTKNRNVK